MRASSRHRPDQRPGPRQGFALPAVLAVTGVVTLIFLVAITALSSMTAEANAARDRVRFLQRAMTAEARLSYLMVTEQVVTGGLQTTGIIRQDPMFTRDALPEIETDSNGLIRLDGRRYSLDIDGPMLVRLQDQAGLININHLSGPALNRFLEQIGIPPSEHGRVSARLVDYKDLDSLKQPEGAERSDYATQGPANRPLRRPSEFLSVLGVRDQVDRRQWNRLRPSLAADQLQLAFNVNAATPQALAIVLGIEPELARTLIRERDFRPFEDTNAVDSAIGRQLPWDIEFLYTLPSSAMIFTLHDTRSAWTYRARLSITPTGIERPIWTDQTEMTEAPRRAKADITDAVRLPYAPY